MTGLLLTATIAVPLLLAAAIGATGRARSARVAAVHGALGRYAWLGALPAGALALLGDDGEHRAEWFLLGSGAALDDVGRPLVGLAAALYALALAFVPRATTRRGEVLTAFLLLCLVGNVGVFVASDVVTFYLSFTLVSFVGYAAVIHTGTTLSRRAGTVYLVLAVLGEAAVLGALLLVASAGAVRVADVPAAVAGSPSSGLIIVLLVAGFGVKAGTVPLHVWLPLAHPAAPTPASAVLSGVMLKAGLVGWLRFLPLGEGDGEPGWGALVLALALAGAFLAVPVGLLQDDPKVILAYSSISQMGFLTALVGSALLDPGLAPACVLAAVVYAVHHGLAKGVLFLGVQAWDAERLPRRAVALVLGVAGASLAGLPMTGGFVAKYVAKEAVGDVAVPLLGAPLADVLPLVGLGSTLLLVRFAVVMHRRERDVRPTPRTRDAAWALLGIAAVVPVLALAQRYDDVLSVPGLLDSAALAAQAWPVVLGLALGAAAVRVARRPRFADTRLAHPRGDLVPPGDVVAVEERAVRAAVAAATRGFERAGAWRGSAAERVAAWPRPSAALEHLQRRVGPWAASGVVLLVLLAAGLVWAVAR
ncbi:complex I subunit 5 family protein [Litorihabitans aurantiacus]|uniref:Hydrogenase n=1 Tax=Litorihabitans aurantiacus TaxID=1930061 RepID=A0AA37UUG1_9MICO|nr:complex I subunit 5 family protein [Litorihabitans aurantiacus]GMA31325.1 hydrogenase [Litorihabitans aurantiacus]